MARTDSEIEFCATVAKVATLADMGIRLTLDMGEDAIIPAAWLMRAKQAGVALQIHVTLVEPAQRAA